VTLKFDVWSSLLVAVPVETTKTNPKSETKKATKSNGVSTDESNLSSDEWLELQLQKIQHKCRLEKAEEVLLEMREQELVEGNDTGWVDDKIADLEKFVADNKEELDELIAKDKDKDESNDDGSRGNKKRPVESADDKGKDDDTEMKESDSLEPAAKK